MNLIKIKRLFLVMVVLILAAGPLASADTVDVAIEDFLFNPDSLEITVGTTVRWTNTGAVPHTTTSDTPMWDSGTMNNGDTFTYTFNAFGEFPYHCTIHPSMTAVIIVTKPVPSTGTYGLIALILLLIAAAVYLIRRRNATA